MAKQRELEEKKQRMKQLRQAAKEKDKKQRTKYKLKNGKALCAYCKQMIDEFVLNHSERSIAFTSMGHLKFLSTLQFVDGMVGNSSSGLTEAPTFKVGTVNIGDRQKGRLKAKSVIDCEPTKESIKKSVDALYSENFRKILPIVVNPYGDGDVTDKIMNVLKNVPLPKEPKKEFYNL